MRFNDMIYGYYCKYLLKIYMRYIQAAVITIIILSSGWVSAQRPVKEFFNEDWKQCDSAVASYYRLITYDEKGSPIGTVRDYFISGELQWEGRYSFLDKYDYDNSKHDGECIWYYKNGKKQTATFYAEGLRSGKSRGWYENGTAAYESNYHNGKLSGLHVTWYESGLLQSFAYYDDGKVIGTDAYNCDEFGECSATEKYDFMPVVLSTTKKNKNNYTDYLDYGNLFGGEYGFLIAQANVKDFTINNATEKIKTTYKEEGLILTTGKEAGLKKVFKPITYNELMVITTKITHVKGAADAKSGIVFSYLDDKNYYSFTVDQTGNYEVGHFVDGAYTELAKGIAYGGSDYGYSDYYDYTGKNNKKDNKKKETYYELFIMGYKDTVQCFV